MSSIPDDQEMRIERAAKIMKILQLAREPGMDLVAVTLNSNPAWGEIQIARQWGRAFELADRDFKITPERLADEMEKLV